MAFTNFYIDSGGTDTNAGSVVNAAASVTVTNASWDITADTFIGLTGTEFAAVNVGEWASIYVDGATVAVYVAQVTTVGALGVSITLSTTAKYGTKPSASATGRSCKVGGSWVSELPLAASGLATTTVPASTKINIKGNLTIAASRTISMAGTTTAPLWFSGYNTTPGDLDNDTTDSPAKPVWTLNSAVTLTASGTHHTWSSLSVVGNVNGFLWTASSSGVGAYVRCRFENTNSNTGVIAFYASAGYVTLSYCWLKLPTTATTFGVTYVGGSGAVYIGCVAEGGGKASFNCTATFAASYVNCISLNNAGVGFLASTGSPRICYSTIYNSTSDGVQWSGTPGVTSLVVGCLFVSCQGVGIKNASGANTNLVWRACNDFYNCSGGNESGFGDSPSWFGQTDSSNPVTSSTNMTPVVGSNALNHGFPGIFENETYSSYPAIGAVQPAVGTTIFSMFD